MSGKPNSSTERSSAVDGGRVAGEQALQAAAAGAAGPAAGRPGQAPTAASQARTTSQRPATRRASTPLRPPPAPGVTVGGGPTDAEPGQLGVGEDAVGGAGRSGCGPRTRRRGRGPGWRRCRRAGRRGPGRRGSGRSAGSSSCSARCRRIWATSRPRRSRSGTYSPAIGVTGMPTTAMPSTTPSWRSWPLTSPPRALISSAVSVTSAPISAGRLPDEGHRGQRLQALADRDQRAAGGGDGVADVGGPPQRHAGPGPDGAPQHHPGQDGARPSA